MQILYKRWFPIPSSHPLKHRCHLFHLSISIRSIKNRQDFISPSFLLSPVLCLSLCRSKFLLPEKFLLTFLAGPVCWQCVLCFSLSEKIFISLSFLKDNFSGYRILSGVFCFVFFFQHFKYFTHCLLACMVCWEVHSNSYPCSSRGKVISFCLQLLLRFYLCLSFSAV